MSAPTLEHGEIEAKFSWLLLNHVAGAGLDYIVASNTAFLLSPETEVAPDVCVLPRAKARLLEVIREARRGAPDLAVEIASPSESAIDIEEKIAEYLAAGTQIVWVAYAKTRRVLAHYRNGEVRSFTADQLLDAGDLLPGLQIPVKDIFPAA